MEADIYVRVSTDSQETEGTSLDTQFDACLKRAKELGCDVAEGHAIREVFSGLTLDRPKLTTLRERVRRRETDAVIVYSTDRLSRDPVHLLLLAEECDKYGVRLVFVMDPLDNSIEGQLMSFVKGWASKVEALKIQERTVRGKKARAIQGRIPSGSHSRLYGYYYVRVKYDGGGVRVVNEEQADRVRQMFHWLVDDMMSVDGITYKMRALGVPTPSGRGYWIRSTVHKILTNPAYMGKTYAFTVTYGEPTYRTKADTNRRKTGLIRRPKSDWIEIPNATPPIVSPELFEAAQIQMNRNKELALHNTKHEYLLHGHLRCEKCGRSYWGKTSITKRGIRRYERRLYRCSGNLKKVTPELCGNRNLNGIQVESAVWLQLEALLTQPELISKELERRAGDASQGSLLQRDLAMVEARLTNLHKRDEKLLRGWLWGQDEAFIEKEKRALDKEKEALGAEKLRLARSIEESRRSEVDVQGLKEACDLIKSNMATLSFENKRYVLEALRIKVFVNDCNVRIVGSVPVLNQAAVSMPSGWHHLARRRGS
jgi:site-specific DNA recombinase